MNKKYIAIILIIGFTAFIVKTLNDAGEFKTIVSHFDGECISIYGNVGAEDITILSNGLAIISSDDRRKTLAGNSVQGSIYAYDLKEKTPQLINLTPTLPFNFHPHGISVHEIGDGSYIIAVVNHSQKGHFIEIFESKNKGLIHKQSIADPKLISPNDLVLINETQMYISNDHGSSSEWMKMIEDYLQLTRSNVVFYDGNKFTISAKGLGYANGINISHDGNILYVAETVGKKITEYAIDKSSHGLTFIQSTEFNSGVDNIELDNEGSLWIGSHPKLLTLTQHAKNSNILSPSQVFKLSIGAEHKIKEVYLNDGGKLSGSSVAAIWRNNLLIGPVLEDHFLHCVLKK
ncbi:MAG: SMP-30/gluconolactonase/LRE family protein [Candidatus Marinimicrobia bacterium]|nr:SMP-30/gluconolactonase/LRE family protein [Candidatus Neomarinimicrobiota bacterium]